MVDANKHKLISLIHIYNLRTINLINKSEND